MLAFATPLLLFLLSLLLFRLTLIREFLDDFSISVTVLISGLVCLLRCFNQSVCQVRVRCKPDKEVYLSQGFLKIMEEQGVQTVLLSKNGAEGKQGLLLFRSVYQPLLLSCCSLLGR